MILGQADQILPEQWQTVYSYRPVLLETFVEKDRFQGTYYQAANRLYLGQTQGKGKFRPAGKQSVPIRYRFLLLAPRHYRH
jgi:Domain of unknown function (DUF4338)